MKMKTKMKTLFWLGILCSWVNSACLQLPHKSNCGECVQELCPPVTSACNDLKLDNCNCCSTCFLGNNIATSSSGGLTQSSKDDADQVVHAETSAGVQKLQGDSKSPKLQHTNIPSFNVFLSLGIHSQNSSIASLHDSIESYQSEIIARTSLPYSADKNKHNYGTSSPQTDNTLLNKKRGRGLDGNIESLPDDLKPTANVLLKTITKVTEQPLTDKIKNCIGDLSLQTCQATMDSGNMTVNSFLGERESQSTVIAYTTEISVASTHFTKTGSPSITRAKRESKLTKKRIGALEVHQVLKDGSLILQLLTNNAPQQVIHCALSQISIPGSHILADIVRIMMKAIHELATYISERIFVIENPTWNNLKQIITESTDKGFAKAFTSIPKMADEVKEFLSYNPTLTQLGPNESDKSTHRIQTAVRNIKTYLESISMLFEESTTTVMRHRVKIGIMELAISGSKLFAEIADAIMYITNAISKSVLESAFIKEKPSLQNLLEVVKNSIIVGVTKSFKVAPEIIHVTIEEIEKNGFIHRDDTSNNFISPINGYNVEPISILEVTKVRPIVNAYLQFICDNYRYFEFNLWGEKLAAPSPNIMPSVLEFLIEVDTHITETLMHLENIVCTSEVLKETDSWNNLLQAGNLVNKMLFKRMALFQSKHNFNLNKLNRLLNHMGCDGTINCTLSDKDSVGNKTLVEMIQTTFKCISNEFKMKTDEMIVRYKRLSTKLSKLPGGKVINIITEVVIQAVNEMSKKMNDSPFITEIPTWFNFWFSVIESMTAGTTKAVDAFIELIDSTKSLDQNETRGKKALAVGMYHERFKRRSQDIGERNALKQNSLASSYHNILHPSSATKAPLKSSDLKLQLDDLIFMLKKSESVHTGEAPAIPITSINLEKTPSFFPKKESTNAINRAKREIEFSMKRIKAVQILHEVLKDGSVILQMLTNTAPQQVMYCAFSQLPIPGSYILADTARTIMEAVHESVVYISQSKSVAENPTWDSLKQGIAEAVEKGFAKASASVPEIVEGVKQFLSFNPTLIELGSDEKVKDGPTHAIETILEYVKTYLRSISHLLKVITSTKMQQRVKAEITELPISGSKMFAHLTEGIMNVTNDISKSLLESAFMKEKPSVQNLLEAAKNSIIVGVTKGFKVAPEVIHVVIQVMENNGFIHKNDTRNIDLSSIKEYNITILKATKARPIINAYLQFICDNFRFSKPNLHEELLIVPSLSNASSVLDFFTEVNTHIIETLIDINNIVCTSKILKERDSWNQLLQASNLVNNTVFERLALLQSKYHVNSTELNQLLNRIGCNGTIKSTLSDKDSVGKKTYIEIIQIALKYISTEIKMKTDEMIANIKKLSIKLGELPGGNVINIVTEVVIQAINEMARKMSESIFITQPPTWFNFWFSLIDVVTGAGMKIADAYAELMESTKP